MLRKLANNYYFLGLKGMDNRWRSLVKISELDTLTPNLQLTYFDHARLPLYVEKTL